MATKRKTAAKRSVKKAASRKRGATPKAPPERVGLIELGGKPATVVGEDVKVGQEAPRFRAQVGSWPETDTWAEIDPLEATQGKVRILAAMPSLSTNVCDMETRRFNQEAASLGGDIYIIGVTTDLPTAQRSWCGAAGVERVMTVSDHMTTEFGVKYGVLLKERRWFRRAVFVVGKDDRVKYAAYMPALGVEPDYATVLAAAKQALAEEESKR